MSALERLSAPLLCVQSLIRCDLALDLAVLAANHAK